MSADEIGDRDAELFESHETDPITAFEGDVPVGTRTPSALSRRLRRYVPAMVAAALVLVVWQVGTTALEVESFILPKPTEIVAALFEKWDVIWRAGLNTLIEAVGGFVIGATLGVLVALATVRWRTARDGLMPFAIAANAIPIIALAPIMNAWFSITSPVSKMAVVAVIVFFPVMINTSRGLSEVDAEELELMRSLASTEPEVMWKVRVPNSLPYFFSALKVGSALALIAAIVAEYFGGPQDVLGQYILNRANLFQFQDAWAGIIVASLVGIGFYTLILGAERIFMPWHVSLRTADDR